MNFGERIRELRKAKNLSQRELAAQTGINFTYISRIENAKLEFSDFPSETTIHKLCDALDGDADELLIMARKIPDIIKERVFERPEVFRKIATLDDKKLDQLMKQLNGTR